MRKLIFFLTFFVFVHPLLAQVSFNNSTLINMDGTPLSIGNPTSLQFGPDERLYLTTQNGFIYALTITRVGAGDYRVTNTETITLVKSIPNYNDNGVFNSGVKTRQVTGILVTGTAENPVLYVGSSDPRIGGGGVRADKDLDTNSGTISRLTRNGGSWEKVDIVRGLPRSEENHANNGMYIDEQTNLMYVAQGGHTNAGSPSNNFAFITEYALSAAILTVDLNYIEALPTKTDAKGQQYKYDLPTVDDPTRPNNPDGSDIGDPFGGNDGLNQAKLVLNGPVQIYSPGYRNVYDIVVTKTPGREGRMYTIDNGANGGWGGHPENEGTDGTVTNNYITGEPGSSGPGPNDGKVNNKDNLHLVTKGFYGGHPTPIRANPAGAGLYTYDTAGVWRTSTTDPLYPLPADWPPVPLSMANPVEGDFRNPGVDDGALYIWSTSTNGVTEYTATNFNGALTGNLLVTTWNGRIYKIELSQDGTQVVAVVELASGFLNPLDVIAQGDGDIFPGSIWAAVYGSKSIAVFEPIDFTNCTGLNDIVLDDDGDGFSNADEIDNGTDPCSPSSKPTDNDGDFFSDLNDLDDDNDAIPDTEDYFALDLHNGLNTALPINYTLLNNDPGTGFFGLGFTGLMANGSVDYLDAFDKEILIAGGAVGAFTVDGVTSGDAYGAGNNQQNTFQFGINVQSSTGPFTIDSRMLSPFFNSHTPVNNQSQGLYLGTGDQDNYLKIALVANSGIGGLEVLVESGGVVKSQLVYALNKSGEQLIGDNVLAANTLDLFLAVDPLRGTVQPKYQIDGNILKNLGNPIQLEGALLTAVQGTAAVAVGLIASSRGSNAPFTATWDYVNVNLDPLNTLGDWHTLTSTNDPEARHENAFVQVGNKFYLLGGRGIKNVNIYDPATDSWSLGAQTPLEMHHFQAIEYKGLLYVVGAFMGSYPHEQPVPNIYIYNPVTDKWIVGPEIPESRRRGSAGAFVYRDKFYLVCGIIDGHYGGHVAWFDEFNPATNSWTVLPDAPRPRDHFQAALIEDKVYAAAGRLSKSEEGVFLNMIAEVDMYNFSTGEWITLPAPTGNIPTQRAGAAVAVLGNEILVIGGESNTESLARNQTEALSNLTHTWRTLTPLDQGRHGTQAIVSNGGIYIAAGNSTQGSGAELRSQEAFYMFNETSPTGTPVSESFLNYPLQVNVGKTKVNQEVSNNITIRNSDGNQGMLVTGLTVTGSSGFLVSSPYPLPFLLKPDASIDLTLSMLSSTAGDKLAALEIMHSGSAGKASVNLYGTVEDNSLLLLSTESLHYLSQLANTVSDPQPIELTNNSDSELAITEIIVTGDNATEFLHDFTAAVTLNPGASVIVNVNFAPVSQGSKVAVLQISHSGSATASTVMLSGEGISSDDLPNIVPVARAGADQALTAGTDGMAAATLNGSASSDADGIITTYSWSKDGTELITGINPTISLPVGTHNLVLTVTDNRGATATDEVVVVVAAEGTTTVVRLNTGGEQYTTGDGKVFAADQYFNGTSSPYIKPFVSIEGTTDDDLYRSERWGKSFSYDIAVPAGNYLVRLHFAEIYAKATGKRIFSITAEGSAWLTNFDIYAEAGYATALVKETEVAITDGVLNLGFVASVENAKISAIELISLDTPASNQRPTAIAGADKNITLPTNSTVLNGSGSDSDGTISSYSWSQVDGPNTAIFSSFGVATPTVNNLIAGTYVFSLTVTDNEGAVSLPDQVDVVVNAAANQQPTVSISSPANGASFTAPATITIAALATDADGTIAKVEFYQGTVKLGEDVTSPYTYTWSGVSADSYSLTARAIDNSTGASTSAVVNITVTDPANQPPVVSNAIPDQKATIGISYNYTFASSTFTDADGDPLAYTAGLSNNTALPSWLNFNGSTRTFSGTPPVSSPASLTIKVTADDNKGGAVSDEFVLNIAAPVDPSVVYRINAGGGQLSNSIGVFSADDYYAPLPGYSYTTTSPIDGTTNDEMYQTARGSSTNKGTFSYGLPLDNGQYNVVLHFAEINFSKVGHRVFDVSLEGSKFLENYDIIRVTGAKNKAVTESTVVNVADGTLNLYFSALASDGGSQRPIVSAIEVIRVTSSMASSVRMETSADEELSSEHTTANSIVVYPNPFDDVLHLKLPAADLATEYVVRLYNALGKEFYSQRFTQASAEQMEHEIDMSNSIHLMTGLYFISVENTRTAERKILKVLKE
ncbi:Kelch repeat-containing protein [Flammeovirgaceae bacterium 311]|nr:Kelch repeat-containing protein [Flammeovirgaceae bacterium 311]